MNLLLNIVHNLSDYEFFINEVTDAGNKLETWLSFSFILYSAGVSGIVFNYKNFLTAMMAVELMYLGAISNFVLYGAAYHDPRGLIYGLLLLILAACESAIGLGILIVLHRFGQTIEFNSYQHLGG